MTNSRQNIIIFPKWKQSLEEESIEAINDKQFKEALTKIDELLSHGVSSFKVNMGKLICLVELREYEAAEDFCESILERTDANYYSYLEFYLTILYQTNQFELLMNIIEDEEKDDKVPPDYKERFRELHRLSHQMNQQMKNRNSIAYLKELELAINEQDDRRQWNFINGLRRIGTEPPKEIIQLLTNKMIHPVTKTTIFNWLRESEIAESVEVEKLGKRLTLRPDQTSKIGQHPIIKKTMFYIIDIEQENPSLYQMIEDLLVRYTYVRYPVIYPEEDANTVAKALIYIGKKNLFLPLGNEKVSNKVNDYIKEIYKCNELYLNVIDD